MDLENLRKQIDSIDQEILDRLNRRVELARQIGHIKHEEGEDIYVPSREEEVFGRLRGQNSGPLPDKAVRSIYREIISAAIELEKPCTGPILKRIFNYATQGGPKQ